MTTALYRRYRPETFADVIGQEHVTEPLMAALRGDRVTHAYLFSGPRGCGKTTSARILARCLNCVQGPTDTPCGECDSCVELARGGPGSLDVVEIDAASHNGVDDARELRERAAFAPARDRFKVFILDEAHMVTTQGFNALLKLVEEPPAHVKFVFATTEPDKVIGTIRSRTHHYPFRLVPPEQLTAYLDQLATAEGIEVAPGVLPLVVRAGGGSVRDSLSVLDQLIAGATGGEVTYERAVALLGFTHGALLDDAIDALAARDGGSLFRVVEHVIDSGHAPRRFVEDLLERLRDLIVVLAAGEHAGSVLRAVPADQLERMRSQAQHLGSGQLSRAADLVNEALTEMTGATSPRLQLELLCARLLLPAADDGVDGYAARLDRLEVALSGGAPVPGRADGPALAAPPVSPPPVVVRPVVAAADVPRADAGPTASEQPPAAAPPSAAPPAAGPDREAADGGAGTHEPGPVTRSTERAAAGETSAIADPARTAQRAPAGEPGPSAGQAAGGEPAPGTQTAEPERTSDRHEEAAAAPPAGRGDAGSRTQPSQPGGAASGSGGMTADQVRRRWPEVLETLARIKRTTWALISQDAQVVDLAANTLSLGFSTSGLASAFRNGPHTDSLQRALSETLGLTVRIDAVVADGTAPAPAAPAGPQPAAAPQSDAVARATADWGEPPAAPPGAAGRDAAAPTESRAQRAADQAPPWDAPVDAEGGGPQSTSGSAVSPGGAEPGAATDGAVAADRPARRDAAAPPPWDVPAGTSGGGVGASGANGPAGVSGSDVPAGMSNTDVPTGASDSDVPAGASNSDVPAGASPGSDRPSGDGTGSPARPGSANDPDDGGSDGPGAGGTRPVAPPQGGPRGGGAERPGAPGGGTEPRNAGHAARGRSAPPDDDIPPAEPPDEPYGEAPPAPTGMSARDAAFAAARRHTTSERAARPAQAAPSAPEPYEQDHPDPSDPDIDSSGLVGAPLVARLLGGTVIDEITEPEVGR